MTKEYEEGYSAAIDGKTEKANPYKPWSIEWQEWLDGFFGAMEMFKADDQNET